MNRGSLTRFADGLAAIVAGREPVTPTPEPPPREVIHNDPQTGLITGYDMRIGFNGGQEWQKQSGDRDALKRVPRRR